MTPSADGNVTVDIADNVATDAAGNNNTAASTLTRTYDPTPPTVTLGSSSPDPTNAPFTVTATFSEDTSDFDETDLTIANGTVSNFSGTGRDYTFEVTPTADGNVTVDIADNVATDAAGNNNTAAAQLTRTYDPTSPTVSLSSTSPNLTNVPFTVTATFSENVTGFDETDLTIANGTVSNFKGSGTDYTFEVTPSADGNVTVDIADNVATDAAGNNNTAASTLTRTYDQTSPTVTLASSSPDPTNAPFTVTATFSEDTSDFDETDLTIANGTVSNFSGTGRDYTFEVTPSADGNVTVDIADNVATDAAGNNNTAASTLTRTYDQTSPTVTLGSSSPDPTNAPFLVTATFSEDTSDFDETDLTIANGTVSNFKGSGRDYTFEVTPSADGNVTVDIADNVATDAAGNNNTAAQLTRTYDPTSPTVSPSSASPNTFEVNNLGPDSSIRFSITQDSETSLGEIDIFSVDSSGNRTQVGSFSLLEGEDLPSSYDPSFTVDRSLLSDNSTLELELVENGVTKVATISSGPNGEIEFDFDGDTDLLASVVDIIPTTNVLEADGADDAAAIDLTGLSGPQDMTFSVFREADFDNVVGFYTTDDATGAITDISGTTLNPGDAGYKEAAIARQLDLTLSGENGQEKNFTGTIAGGKYLGVFLVVDGTNPTASEVFFSHTRANSDGADHSKLLGDNTFGFEDKVGLGDADFDDVIVSFDFV